jgi:hypothetical protein
LTAGEPLGDEWTEVLDVVRHHRAEFVGCGLKKGPVAEADDVRAVRDRVRSTRNWISGWASCRSPSSR